MPPSIELFGYHFPDTVYLPVGSLLFVVVWMAVGLTLKSLAFSRLKHWSEKTATRIDDLLISALSFPLVLLILASGLLVLVRIGVSTQYLSHDQLYRILLIVGVVGIVLFADSLLRGVIETYADKVEIFRVAGGLVQSTVRGLVLVTGVLVMLGTLGINITPVIASLGVGSLAVALALQPTLENFLAGIQVISDRQIMEGHFVRLESGEEGTVVKINMRSTWLRTNAGNMVIFPNKLLVATRITNYDYPTREVEVVVPLSCHYSSDLARVERIALEVAATVQQDVDGALRTHVPVLRFTLLAESGINFNVILRAADFNFGGLLRHTFIQRIVARFRAENIVVPYPVRALNISQENVAFPKHLAG